MNWDAVGAIGEAVGGVAVILTLIYIARQIRQSTGAVLVASHAAMLTALRSTRHAVALDAALADIVVRGEAGMQGLSELEARRFEELVLSQFDIWEQAFLNHESGTIDDVVWGGWDNWGREKISTRGHREVWKKCRLEFYKPFRSHVDRNVFPASPSGE